MCSTEEDMFRIVVGGMEKSTGYSQENSYHSIRHINQNNQ